MEIDFRRISGPKESKADNYALMCARLILTESPEAKPVEGKGGDQGLDTFIGKINGKLSAFQFKYFCVRIGKSQKAQIKASLKTALSHNNLLSWKLVLPIDMNIHEQKWFQGFCSEHASLHIELWGETKLMNLLSMHPEIAKDFFEPFDKLGDIELKLEEHYLILKKIKDFQSDLDERFNELVEMIKPSIQIIPNQPTEIHEMYKKQTVQEIIYRSRLSVLIWGPGEKQNELLFKKRIQIRDKLRAFGHEADFSEDILTSNALSAGGINLSVAELIQASGYEYIVCIMASPGSIGEVHDFCHMPKIVHKMTICLDEQHLSGYSGQGLIRIFEGNHGHLEKFKFPQDINSCNLLGRVVYQVENRAAAKQDHIARSILEST